MPPCTLRRTLRALAAAGVAFGVAVGPASALAASTPTAASVIKAANAALAKQSGVHIVAITRSGTTITTVVVDLGKTTGAEEITSGSKQVTITLTPAFAYVKGSATGMTTIMGLTKAQEKIVGSKSIAMAAGTSPYASFKASLTTTALLSFLPAAKGTTLLAPVKGSGTYRLRWTEKGTAAASSMTSLLVISSSHAALPVSETITGSNSGGVTTFSRWGETVTPTSPGASAVISYKKVFG